MPVSERLPDVRPDLGFDDIAERSRTGIDLVLILLVDDEGSRQNLVVDDLLLTTEVLLVVWLFLLGHLLDG